MGIATSRRSNNRRLPLLERVIEVVNEQNTGEVLLDEALRVVKSNPEQLTVANWIDLLSGMYEVISDFR